MNLILWRRVPPNCSFEVDDIEKPWLWKEPFDFIHSANLAQGIRDWPTYTKRIYEGLAPGGVVQLHESAMKWYTDDDSIPKGGALESYQKLLNKALDLAGAREICIELESHLIKAGFVDVKVAVKKLPIGTWAKDRRKKVPEICIRIDLSTANFVITGARTMGIGNY